MCTGPLRCSRRGPQRQPLVYVLFRLYVVCSVSRWTLETLAPMSFNRGFALSCVFLPSFLTTAGASHASLARAARTSVPRVEYHHTGTDSLYRMPTRASFSHRVASGESTSAITSFHPASSFVPAAAAGTSADGRMGVLSQSGASFSVANGQHARSSFAILHSIVLHTGAATNAGGIAEVTVVPFASQSRLTGGVFTSVLFKKYASCQKSFFFEEEKIPSICLQTSPPSPTN